MTPEKITEIKKLAAAGKSKKEICTLSNLSWYSVYTVLTGKAYPRKSRKKENKVEIVGLSSDHKRDLFYIAKNKDISQNRLLLSYVREAINKEPKQNKIYED